MTPLPTRLTANNTSMIGQAVDVFYNGHELANVVEADTAKGWVEVMVTDAMGRAFVGPDGNARTKVLHGHVTARRAS